MTNITTIMQTHLERIISEGNLSTDDIHNLSLVDRVLFQEVTNPRRVQTLWERHLSFPTLFLFDRPVHVYDYESESDEIGRVFEYSKKPYQGQQLVCRKKLVSNKPDLLIAEGVVRRYDLWLSFFVGDRIKTLNDVLLFDEKFGNYFPLQEYSQFINENEHYGNGPVSVYAEISHVLRVLLESVQRVKEETTEEDNLIDLGFTRALIPMIKKGYLHLDSLFSILYLMGKETGGPAPFQIMENILTRVLGEFEGDPDKSQQHLKRLMVFPMAQAEYALHMYLGGSSIYTMDGLYIFSPQVEGGEEGGGDQSLQALLALFDLPGFTFDRFSASVHLNYSNRSTHLLISQLTCFKEMVEGGYLTFERLKTEYPCVIAAQFNIAICTPTFLDVLSKNLIRFHVVDSNHFHQLPYFFHLEDHWELKVPEALKNFSASFMRFLGDVKSRGLQRDFEEFYALPFFELFKPLTRFKFYTPVQFIMSYLQIQTEMEQGDTEVPLFRALRQGDFKAESFMDIYKKLVHTIEQTLAKHLNGLEISPVHRRCIEGSRASHALFMRMYMFNYSKRLEGKPSETIEESLALFSETFEAFCADFINPSVIATITEDTFHKEFKDLYDAFIVNNSFVKASVSLDQYTIEKRHRFDSVLSRVDAMEYVACLKEKGQDHSFEKLVVFTQNVRAFNRQVIEQTMKYSYDLPIDPMLLDIDFDIDEQLSLYSVLSEPKVVTIYLELSRQYYLLMASIFGDKSALSLVNKMITDAHFLRMSVYIASDRSTIDQYSDFILSALKIAFLARSRTFISTVRFEILIGHCMTVYMDELSKSILEQTECDYSAARSKITKSFSLELPNMEAVDEPLVDEIDQDEVA